MPMLDTPKLILLAASVIALVACEPSAADQDSDPNTTGSGAGTCVDEDRSSECAQQTTEASCRALLADTPEVGTCLWTRWVTTTIDDEGVCAYGEIRESCDFEPCREACVEWPACGTKQEMGLLIHDNETGMEEVALGERCSPPASPTLACTWDINGELQDGSATCRCLCDPGFPS